MVYLFHPDLPELDVLLQSGCANVLRGGLQGVVACIRTVDLVRELALIAIVLTQGVEQLAVEVFPALEGKLLAEDAGRDVQGDQCRLYEYRA